MWDRQAKITIGVKVHKSQIVHFFKKCGTVSGNV